MTVAQVQMTERRPKKSGSEKVVKVSPGPSDAEASCGANPGSTRAVASSMDEWMVLTTVQM